MTELLLEFFQNRGNADKLADFYFDNQDFMLDLKNRYPDWESYVERFISEDVRLKLRERGVPL